MAPKKPKKNMDGKDRFRKEIAGALAGAGIQAIEDAVTKAQKNKLPQAELDLAMEALDQRKAQQKAREDMVAAIEKCTIKALRQAVQGAEESGLAEEDISEARQVLHLEEKKTAALDQVQAAMDGEGTQFLQDAIKLAESLGVPPEGLADARKEFNARWEAELELAMAADALDVSRIQAALQAAERASVGSMQLDLGYKALERAEERSSAASSLPEVMGIPIQAPERLEMLRSAVVRARRALVDGKVLAPAEAALKEEEARAYARERYNIALMNDPKELAEAVKLGLAAKIPKDELDDWISHEIASHSDALMRNLLYRKKLQLRWEAVQDSQSMYNARAEEMSREISEAHPEASQGSFTADLWMRKDAEYRQKEVRLMQMNESRTRTLNTALQQLNMNEKGCFEAPGENFTRVEHECAMWQRQHDLFSRVNDLGNRFSHDDARA